MKEQTSAGKKVSKKTMQTQIRKIHNSAQSLLKGVVALEECFDRKRSLMRVLVGTGTKTMGAADSLRKASNTDALSSGGGSGGTGAGAEEAQPEMVPIPSQKQDSFRRKSKIEF